MGKKRVLWAFVILGLLLSSLSVNGSLATRTVIAQSEQDSFTSVAGTDSVVMDRRHENNETVIGWLLVIAFSLLAIATIRRFYSRNN